MGCGGGQNALSPSTPSPLPTSRPPTAFTRPHAHTATYLESTQLEWVQEMVGALLSSGGAAGVITVDWSKAAPPTYAQAVANIRLVGVMVGRVVSMLVDMGVSEKDIHMIGHSLGAHLMSYAASHFTATRGLQVGRLTGLDPAGPYFANTAPEVRLDPSDAAFVDVIHTDTPTRPWELDRLGAAEAMGHLDFYPNGGRQQAGCQGSAASHIDREETVAGGVLSYIGCSHRRSFQFFTESTTNKRCRFVGVECTSWEEYKAGACWGCEGRVCAPMGYPAYLQQPQENTWAAGDDVKPFLARRIFLGTNPERPFCAEQYRVTLITSGHGDHGDLAHFTVTLRGHLRTVTISAPESASWVEGGGRVSWVGWGSGELSGLYNLRVEYEADQSLLQALVWRFKPPTLSVEAFTVQMLSTGVTVRFPFCGAEMQAGQSYTLLPNASCQ
ncbi:pancreatic lipase-related protein 2-like isoform X2 [Portunus trituberculatus]|uniref:pancreatic lipase-related protein 2-like isoform X2 n=1 Tax=Portunus trituberculatus TaxID=210409 RepID=UPI001E1CC493|nr:pancreatic lipase-related protein 2-like isoform X2 [Portunus trituberculatus]